MKPGKTFFGRALIVTGALLLLLSQSAPSQAAPTPDFATYLGGSEPLPPFDFTVDSINLAAMDQAHAIALDDAGNVYVAGETWSDYGYVPPGGSSSGDFPVTRGPIGPFWRDIYGEIFLTKFSPTGELLASTIIGGSINEGAHDIAVDDSGNIYLTGLTESDDFPLLNAYQSDPGTYWDAFLIKLDTDFNLLYSTYLGGTGWDEGHGLAVDDAGHAYVTGVTYSTDFPTKGAFMLDPDGDRRDAWVAKFDTTLAGEDSLIYSTYLDGYGDGLGIKIAIDSAGHAYVLGRTKADDFPLRNEYSVWAGGCYNYFVAKLNPAGDDLLYSTYLGRTYRFGGDIAANDDGHVYVTGTTAWHEFPTRHAYQDESHGDHVFITRLNTNLAGDASLVYSTFFGGTAIDEGYSIAADPTGKVYVTGCTNSPDFPLREFRPPSVSGDFDIFVAKFDTALTGDDSLLWSTYFGGTAEDIGTAVAIGEPTGGLALSGVTLSPDFPVTPSAFQTFHAYVESYDAFVMKFSEPADIAIPLPDAPGVTYYPPLAFSVLRPGPSECQPLASVQISRGTLHTQVGFPKFQAPANLYLALYGSDEPLPDDGSNNQNLPPLNEMYFLNGQGELEPSMTPWMTGVTDPVSQLIAVEVNVLQIDEPYCNLVVIAQAPSGPVDQLVDGLNQQNNYYAWITQISVPQNQLEQTVLSLEGLLAKNLVTKDKALQKAIAYLQNSLNPEYWLDPWTLDDELGRKALKAQEKAVQKLMQTKSQQQEITQAIEDILEADATLATYAIVDAVALGGKPRKTKRARENLIKGGKEQADEDFNSAINFYEKAWTQAEKAM